MRSESTPVLAMDSLSDLSFQNLTPTVWLAAAPAPMASTHSSTSESSAAPERFRNFVIKDQPFYAAKSGNFAGAAGRHPVCHR